MHPYTIRLSMPHVEAKPAESAFEVKVVFVAAVSGQFAAAPATEVTEGAPIGMHNRERRRRRQMVSLTLDVLESGQSTACIPPIIPPRRAFSTAVFIRTTGTRR